MPELPEVADAARRLAAAADGRIIAGVRVLHAAQRRTLPARHARALRGARIDRVERRGKFQLLHLDDDRVLTVHFRMAGDWTIDRVGAPLPRYARVALELDDGTRVVLDDPRALSTVRLTAADALPLPPLGPDPFDRALSAACLHRALARRGTPIKPLLLDQSLIAGVGNIYAAEALWRARIDPRARADTLDQAQAAGLLRAIRATLRAAIARARRYYGREHEAPPRFAVYDREGAPCRRCGTPIARITQAARSTYFCPACQR